MCVPYTRINFDKWRILSLLDKKIWQDIELVHTISGGAALLVKSGNLYFVGKWGQCKASIPEVIEKLKFEKVRCIASGTQYAAIVCNKGFVCTIGIKNYSGQLGVEEDQYRSIDKLFGRFPVVSAIIVDVCCGDDFTLALDNAGMVWYWGSLFNTSNTTPRRLSITNIIKIAAESRRFAALDQSGKVYCSSSESTNLRQVTSHLAQQIVCCFGDLYILTKEYTLLKYKSTEKIDLNCQINYIASNSSDMLVARSTNGEFLSLINANGTFQQMKSTNILECFANTKMPGVYSTGGLEFASVYEENNMLVENFAQLYFSQKFSDVDIVLSDGPIHAHKCILATRSELFNRLLTIKSNKLNFSNANSSVMKSYVNYIYTGRLHEIHNFDHLLELYDMTKDDSNNLLDYCIKQGKSLINEQNALAYYKASTNFNNTVLMRQCAEVVVKNIEKNAVTELFKSLSGDELHKLFAYGTKGDQ